MLTYDYTNPKNYVFVVKPVTLSAGDEELPEEKSTQSGKVHNM